MAFSTDKTGAGTTTVLHGSENVMNTIIQFLYKSTIIDSCGDAKAPKLIIEAEEFKKFVDGLKASDFKKFKGEGSNPGDFGGLATNE